MKKPITLRPSQQVAKNFLLSRPSCALWLDMGVGKTLVTLDALHTINPRCHVLIIAPKNIARSVWQDEIDKWGYPFRTQSLIVNEKGRKLSKAKYVEIFEKIPTMEPTIFYINREMVKTLIDYFAPNWYFPIVIIDEAQSFKNFKSERFKALKAVRPQIQHMIQLSGTPSPNGLMDIWAQIYLIDEGARLGRNITAYRNTYFDPGRVINGYPYEWKIKPGAEAYIYQRLGDVAIAMSSQGIDLPEMVFNDLTIHMEPDQVKAYKRFKREKVLDISDGETITAINAGVLYARLSQMASGSIYTEDAKTYEVIHRQKVEMCRYILENCTGSALIAYHFKSELDMIMSDLAGDIDIHVFDGSKEMIDNWNAGKYKAMLIHPASAGHGLNIQYGGNHLIWYTLPDSLESYQQTLKRLHRSGQKNTVVVHRLITKGTIDEIKIVSLERKAGDQMSLLDSVRATIDIEP